MKRKWKIAVKLMLALCVCTLFVPHVFGTTDTKRSSGIRQTGDTFVRCYNLESGTVETKTYETVGCYNGATVEIELANGVCIERSIEQQIYLADHGWVSYRENSEAFSAGESVLYYDAESVETVAIVSIEYHQEETHSQTYVNVAENHNYFYEGVLVHNACGVCQGGNVSGCGCTQPPPCSTCGLIDRHQECINGVHGCVSTHCDESECGCSRNHHQEAVDKAQEALKSAKKNHTTPEDIAKLEEDIVKAQQEMEEYQKSQAAQQAGDPVLITSGKYIQSENDIVVRSGLENISVSRTYISGVTQSGSYGQGWYAGIDSRIIRGITKGIAEAASKAEAYAASISDSIQELQPYTKYSEAQAAIADLQVMYAQAYEVWQKTLRSTQDADTLSRLNEFVIYDGTPDVYTAVGNNNLTYIDESGTPLVFIYDKNGTWKAIDEGTAQKVRIESRDGADALSSAGFIVYEKGGVKKYFDRWGLLEKTTDRVGNESRYERDTQSQQLKKITSAEGVTITLTYNSSGYISALKTSEGQTVLYGYTGDSLTSVTDSDADSARYTYDSDGNLTKLVKPDGASIQFIYGLEGAGGAVLTTSTVNEEGGAETFEYERTKRITTYSDHSGVTMYYYYDTQHRIIKEVYADGSVHEYGYDSKGNRIEMRINGELTRYSYDERGNRTQAHYSDGSTEQWTYNSFDQTTFCRDRDGYTSSWQYDDRGNCTALYSGASLVMSGTYDSKGLLTQSTDGEGNTTQYRYDPFGNLREREAGGATEKWTYDGQNRITAYTDAESRKWSYSYTAKTTTETSPTGLLSVYTYNNRKDLVSLSEEDTVSGEKRLTEYSYDKRHLVSAVSTNGKTIERYTYTPSGKPETELQGENGRRQWKTTYSYDKSGRVSQMRKNSIDEGGIEGGEVYSETYSYEKTGGSEKRTVTTAPDRQTAYSYDPWKRVTEVTNALSEVSKRTLTSGGRIKAESASHGGKYQYGYDTNGRMNAIGEEGKEAVQVHYNSDGTIARKTDRMGNTTTYVYDGRGNLIQEKKPEGVSTYTYDKAGRLTSKIYGERVASSEQYTAYSYGSDNRTVSVSQGGIPCRMETQRLGRDGEHNRRRGKHRAL